MQTIQCIRLPTVASPVRRACAPNRARTLRVLAADNNTTTTTEASSTPSTSSSNATVFYGGQSYTEAEWKQAVANGTVGNAAPSSGFSQESAPQLSELMAFNGAPEIINSRLAMLGVVAALGAEFSSGSSVMQQLSQEPTLIALTFVLISAASLIPLMSGGSAKDEKFGPFNSSAELLNGRAAMMGFASLIIIEAVRGSALF